MQIARVSKKNGNEDIAHIVITELRSSFGFLIKIIHYSIYTLKLAFAIIAHILDIYGSSSHTPCKTEIEFENKY